MRADEVRRGDRAPNGTHVTRHATSYGDSRDDGVTTLWWSDGLITHTLPAHTMTLERRSPSPALDTEPGT